MKSSKAYKNSQTNPLALMPCQNGNRENRNPSLSQIVVVGGAPLLYSRFSNEKALSDPGLRNICSQPNAFERKERDK